MAQTCPTTGASSRNDPNDGCPPSGFNRCASSRAKRTIGASPVAPAVRTFATSRSHSARCLECLPAREGMPRDRVLLHVADAILRLALRARPIRRAGARTEAPMLRERDELVVKLNRPAHRVMAHHERAWIVHQHFLRHAAEGRECAF